MSISNEKSANTKAGPIVASPESGSTRIVVTLDGSRLAEAILPQAIALARATKAGLTLVRVIRPLKVAGYSVVAIVPEN